MTNAVAWQTFEQQQQQLAIFGKTRLDGKVAYLATIRGNGQPRAHPVTPVIGEGHCFIFVEPTSLKARDLQAQSYFCLHCAMNDSSGSSGEFQMTGIARQVDQVEMRSLAESLSSFRPSSSHLLFELLVTEVLSTSYLGGRPNRRKWVCTDAQT